MNKLTSAIDAADAVVLFVDLEHGIIELTQTNPMEKLRKAVSGLARLARIFEMPVIVSAVQDENGTPAEIIPEIAKEAGPVPTHHRTTCNSFRDAEIVASIQSTGRRTLLIAGVATELAVQLPAITAAELGYRVYVVLDACGGISERTEQAALLRITKAGGATVSVMTLAGEIAGDFREARAQQAVGILYEMAKA